MKKDEFDQYFEQNNEGTDNAAYQHDGVGGKAPRGGRREKKKTERKEDGQGRDPTMLSLFRQAVNRNAELQNKTMTETSRRQFNNRQHVQLSSSRSSSRDNLLQSTEENEKAKDNTAQRSKKVVNAKLQSGKEKHKYTNGLSQMSGSLPPAYNKQRVVYFQNRFIVLDASDRNVSSANSTINKLDNEGNISKINSGKLDTMETSFSKINNTTVTDSKRKDIDEDNSVMDARGIDIILTDPDNSSKQIRNMDSFNAEDSKGKTSIWRKINRVLMDDRVKASNGQIVLENRHPEEYRILKKVLNILFLTVGITLFVSVIIVVIYAFIVGDEDNISVLKITTNRPTTTTTSATPAVG